MYNLKTSLYFGLASGLVWLVITPLLGRDYAMLVVAGCVPGLVIALGAYINAVKEKPWGRDLIKIGILTLTLCCLSFFIFSGGYGLTIVLIPLIPLITGIISLRASREDEDDEE